LEKKTGDEIKSGDENSAKGGWGGKKRGTKLVVSFKLVLLT
jgi:hypothetical protein